MQSINKYQEHFNLGGVELIQFAPIEDIESIPVHDKDNKVTGPLTFLAGKNWLDLYFTEGTINYEFTEEENDNGGLITSVLTGDLPKLTQENETKLLGSIRKRFIIRFKDNNGQYRIMGTITNPVRTIKKGRTGNNSSAKNSITITFTWQYKYQAAFYKDGSISIPNEFST